MLIDAKIYWPESITTMLLPYTLNYFVEKLNLLKVDDYGITTIEKFAGTTIYISLKNHHTWGCHFYVLDAIL